MSEWFYINLAYGLTWAALAGYAVYLRRRASTANASLRRAERENGGER